MTIETNLNLNFSRWEDLKKYMEEEEIAEVIVSSQFEVWGIKFPKEKLTIQDIEKRIKHLRALNG